MDAGWGLRGFWGMVLHNLRVRICRGDLMHPAANIVLSPLLAVPFTQQEPPAEKSLRPSDDYVHGKIRPLVEDFRQRREYAVLQDLRSMVDDIALIVR